MVAKKKAAKKKVVVKRKVAVKKKAVVKKKATAKKAKQKGPTEDTPLNDKQQRFVEEYLIDMNATQAAIRAGYSKHTAKDIGCQNLAKLNIAKAISDAQAGWSGNKG